MLFIDQQKELDIVFRKYLYMYCHSTSPPLFLPLSILFSLSPSPSPSCPLILSLYSFPFLFPSSLPLQELRLIFPNAQRLNRGNYVMAQLVEACRANDITDLIIVHEHRGEPGSGEKGVWG